MAMWNLNGDDIARAKDELKGRRAAIQARYESELKQLETDIADLETFEQFAVRFAAELKPGDAPAAPLATISPEPVSDSVVAEIVAQVTGEQAAASADAPAAAADEPAPAASAEAAPASAAEPAASPRGASRWRMRLNTGEANPS